MKASDIDRTKEWTVDDFALLEETKTLCELIDGEIIMSPSPANIHQVVSSNLHAYLWMETLKNGSEVYHAPMDLHIDYRNVFQPDLILIKENPIDFSKEHGLKITPDLVVEVISPANASTDRVRKKKAYLDMGVQEYWIIDPLKKTLEIYTPATGETQPHFQLTEKGQIKSTVLPLLDLDFERIFNRRAPKE